MKSTSRITGAVLALSVTVGVSYAAGPDVAAVSKRRGGEEPVSGSLKPQPYERDVAMLVADMLQTYHYEKHAIDDVMSERWFDNYIDSLDYYRMVFLQSDIDEFRTHRDTLDDELFSRPPKLETAMLVHERYRERMRHRADYVHKLLEQPLDLTNDESYDIDRHDAGAAWPKTQAEANELWRKRTEDDLIEELLAGRDTEPEIRERLAKRYDRVVRQIDDTESADILELWLGALTRAYDPHSAWFKPATNDNFDIDITNSVEGIGASLTERDEYTTVAEVIAGGPASKNGHLRKDDRIMLVAQGGEEPVDVVGLRLDKVVRLIRGPKGTQVTLHVEHADSSREVIKLTRDQVTIEDSAAEGHVEQVGSRKLGVVDLPSFYVDPNNRRSGRRASQDVKRALEKLQDEHVDGVILDLRHNGGGSLTEAIDVAGLFLPGGPVVQVRDRDGRIEAMHDTDPGVAWAGPLVVLTDATSASASEIVAGALQDYGRGLVVGDKSTHGKGTVQQVAQLTPQLQGRYQEDVGGALKLTVQKFYRVSGGSTQNRGVLADVTFPSLWDGLDVHESDLPYALAWDRIPPAPHVRMGDFTKILPELTARSEKRRNADEDFDKLDKALAERAALEGKPVSLVLETRKKELAERKERAGILDGDAEAEAEEDEKLTPEQRKAKAREGDFVLDEALAVLGDMVELGAGRPAAGPPKD
ncbi:MAG: carboxy terminal-processing peptidase [Myxococcota bacterium]